MNEECPACEKSSMGICRQHAMALQTFPDKGTPVDRDLARILVEMDPEMAPILIECDPTIAPFLEGILNG